MNGPVVGLIMSGIDFVMSFYNNFTLSIEKICAIFTKRY